MIMGISPPGFVHKWRDDGSNVSVCYFLCVEMRHKNLAEWVHRRYFSCNELKTAAAALYC